MLENTLARRAVLAVVLIVLSGLAVTSGILVRDSTMTHRRITSLFTAALLLVPLAACKSTAGGAVRTLAGSELGPHYVALIGDAQHNPALADELRNRLIEPLCAAAADRIRHAQRLGQVREDYDPDLVVSMLYGGLYHRLLLLGTAPDQAFVDSVVDMAFAGLRA